MADWEAIQIEVVGVDVGGYLAIIIVGRRCSGNWLLLLLLPLLPLVLHGVVGIKHDSLMLVGMGWDGMG